MASTNVTNGGGTKTKDRLNPSTRNPPSNVTVRKSTGSTMKSTSAWFLELLVGVMVSGQWSVVSGPWSVVRGQLSVVRGGLSVVGSRLRSPSCDNEPYPTTDYGQLTTDSFDNPSLSCAQHFQRIDITPTALGSLLQFSL